MITMYLIVCDSRSLSLPGCYCLICAVFLVLAVWPILLFSERELVHVRTFAICHRPSVRLSVVCHVRAPYSGD